MVISAPASKGWVIYKVKSGDTLNGVAYRFGVDKRAIMWSSRITNAKLSIGQVLRIPLTAATTDQAPRIPPGVRTYTVKDGDTLETVADRFGVSVPRLISNNPALPSLDRLAEGTVLYVSREPGLILRLGKDDDLLKMAQRFGLSAVRLAAANGVDNPMALREGDMVIIPGIEAKTTYQRLLTVRAEERRKAEEERQRRLAEQRRQQELRQAERLRQQQLAAQRQRQASQARVNRSTTTSARRVNVSTADASGFQWPVGRFVITSYYGVRGAYQRFHTGVDLAAPTGTPIYASKAGQVDVAGWSSWGYGIHVILDHGSGVETLYGHMSRLAVRSGQYVDRGELIGYVGSTGWSTGPHLHFEVRIGGATRNPMAYLP